MRGKQSRARKQRRRVKGTRRQQERGVEKGSGGILAEREGKGKEKGHSRGREMIKEGRKLPQREEKIKLGDVIRKGEGRRPADIMV